VGHGFQGWTLMETPDKTDKAKKLRGILLSKLPVEKCWVSPLFSLLLKKTYLPAFTIEPTQQHKQDKKKNNLM
jgi:hypothetical protein